MRTEILVLASWLTVGPPGRKAAEARVSGVGTLPAYICPHKFRMDFLIPKAIAAHYFGGGGGANPPMWAQAAASGPGH